MKDVSAAENEILVVRCQRGERDAVETLIRDWESRLFAYVRRHVADQEYAWQILQEVWLQVLRNIRSLRDPTRLPMWLYAVTRNACMNHHRREYARVKALDDAWSSLTSAESRASIEDEDLVRFGLARIPEGDREILTLFFLRELSIDEVAGLLGIPPGTVKSRLFKAKRVFREALGGER